MQRPHPDLYPRLERYLGATKVNEPTRDQSPGRRRLSPEVLVALRRALECWARADPIDDTLLRPALHAVATEARERGVRAEELLIVLKSTWYEIAGPPSLPHASGGNKRLDELVTACIKAYYG